MPGAGYLKSAKAFVMSYKILRIANINYSGAFDRLYAERPGLKEACYQEQLEV